MALRINTDTFALGPSDWLTGSVNPALGAGVTAPVGSWYFRTSNNTWWRKAGAGATEWQIVSNGSLTWYGDGVDGAITLPVGTTTLTADMFYSTLIIPNGAILKPANFRIYCSSALIIEAGGSINANGNNASGSSGGSAPSGSGSLTNVGAGATGQTTNGNTPGSLNQRSAAFPLTVGIGGAGGDGSAGTGGVPAAAFNGSAQRNYGDLYSWYVMNTFAGSQQIPAPGNGGGGGGGGGAGFPGGGGGSAGQYIWIAAPVVENDGTITTVGGNGAAPPSGGNAGGGGGGGGGTVVLFTKSFEGTSPVVTGGTGGALSGTGTAGANGNDGMVLEFVA